MTDRILAVGSPPTFRQQVARALDRAADDVDWVAGVTDAEGAVASGGAPPDVLVVSPGVTDTDAIRLAEFVAASVPVTAVVLVRERAPEGLLAPAMRAGVRDVVDLSRGHQELREALERALSWSTNLRSTRDDLVSQIPGGGGSLISVFSSKGGTGKTFLSCNLAQALSHLTGQDTAVVDLDFQMGDVLAYFGKEPARAVADLAGGDGWPDRDQIMAAGTPLDEHLWAFGAPLDPAAEGVSPDAVTKVLRRMQSTFRYTVVDSPAGYSDQALASLEISDPVLLVTGLDVVGLQHLSVAIETLLSLGLPRDRLRVVLNRAESKVGLTMDEVERVMKLYVDAMIPSSRLVPLCLNKGRPVFLEEPRSDVAESITRLAKTLIASAGPADRSAGPQQRQPATERH